MFILIQIFLTLKKYSPELTPQIRFGQFAQLVKKSDLRKPIGSKSSSLSKSKFRIAVQSFGNAVGNLLFGSNHTGRERDVDSFLYWNRAGIGFRERDCERLPTHSATGTIAADLNEDGYVDLVVANHKVDGDHRGFSSVWWNGPDGFSKRSRTDLPTEGPHGISSIEPGNILNRGPEEYYTSAPYCLEKDASIESISWEAEIPPKTWVKASLRTAESKERLYQARWSRWFDLGDKIDGEVGVGKWVQYKLALGAINSLRTPRVTNVRVEFAAH